MLMPVIKCPGCSTDISTYAKQCPTCGITIKKSSPFPWLIGSILAFVILGVIFSGSWSPPTTATIAAAPAVKSFNPAVNADYTGPAALRIVKPLSQEAAKTLPAVKRLSREHDDFGHITWYRDRSTPKTNRTNQISTYIGWEDGGTPYMRFSVNYTAKTWLFIDRFTILADGQSFDFHTSAFEHDNYDTIWEWHDEPMSLTLLNALKAVSASKSTRIRFYGHQYYDDRIVPQAQKDAIKHVFDAYTAIGAENLMR
jgi:hypothetical protein